MKINKLIVEYKIPIQKITIFFIIVIYKIMENLKEGNYFINENYQKIQKNINLYFNNKLKNKIRIALYTISISKAGIQRSTSLILNNFYKINIFKIYLFTKIKKEDNEFIIPKKVKRKVVKNTNINILIKEIRKNKIDILIYQFPYYNQIIKLSKLKNVTILFYIHQSFLYWIYNDYLSFKFLYKSYQNIKYLISLIPFENDYLFRKWGIRSILMDNFITYEYKFVIPSDLSSKTIIMLGRADDKLKRFELGIKAMNYIIKDIPDSEMIIISEKIGIESLDLLIKNLKLENRINFVGYTEMPEIYFKNVSLHIFPSISECFPMVLCETKIYGIPNILLGINYVSMINGGTIIIYDDSPKTIANEAINILKNKNYRRKLGKEAKKSMKKYNNKSLLKKWIELILSIYNGDIYYKKLIKKEIKMSDNKAINIIKKQIKLLKIRNKKFFNISFHNLLNFNFMENLNL